MPVNATSPVATTTVTPWKATQSINTLSVGRGGGGPKVLRIGRGKIGLG
jgi:hypothetical protein